MPRQIPDSIQQEMFGPRTGEFEIEFLIITHPTLAPAIRVVNDIVDWEYNSLTYMGCPFNINLLSDTDEPPRAELAIQNVDRQIGNIIQLINDPVELTLLVLHSSDFDLSADPRTENSTANILYEANNLYIRTITVDASTVKGELTTFDYSSEPFPSIRATADNTPALYR